MSKREYWFAKNISNKVFTIGDLFKVPSLEPQQRVNLLDFHTKEEVEQSVSLITIIENGWLTITKTLDGVGLLLDEEEEAERGLSTPSNLQLDLLQSQVESLDPETVAIDTVTTDVDLSVTTRILLVDATDNHVTVTLTSAVGRLGRLFTIKRINPTGNAVTIETVDSQTIDGNSSITLSAYVSVVIVSDDANWYIL